MAAYDESLLEEVRDDPETLGYAALTAANNDEAVAALLNETMMAVVGEISRSDLATWAAATGMRAKIEDVSKDAESPLRSSALAIIDVLKGASAGIDLAKPTNMGILDAWESATLLSAEDKAAFVALATHDTPRSVVLFGKLVTANDVARVVRDDLGNSLLGA
jgi:hypothetical protein